MHTLVRQFTARVTETIRNVSSENVTAMALYTVVSAWIASNVYFKKPNVTFRMSNREKISRTLFGVHLLASSLFFPGVLVALEIDTDRYGSDYQKHVPASPDPNICAQKCLKDKNKCKAFSYVKPTSSTPKGICWLKSSIPTADYDKCCISGVVRRDVCVHGNSGQFQDKGVNGSHYGGGIIYYAAGKGSWLQYSIPSQEVDSVIEGIWVKFSISKPEFGWIEAIHIWDGNSVIQKFDNQFYGGSLTPNAPAHTKDMLLPLTKPRQVKRGIGISIRPATKKAAPGAATVKFDIHSVCARYTVSP